MKFPLTLVSDGSPIFSRLLVGGLQTHFPQPFFPPLCPRLVALLFSYVLRLLWELHGHALPSSNQRWTPFFSDFPPPPGAVPGLPGDLAHLIKECAARPFFFSVVFFPLRDPSSTPAISSLFVNPPFSFLSSMT